jgi:hypothetical protein
MLGFENKFYKMVCLNRLIKSNSHYTSERPVAPTINATMRNKSVVFNSEGPITFHNLSTRLKMETSCLSEKLESDDKSSCSSRPEGPPRYLQRRQNLKSNILEELKGC